MLLANIYTATKILEEFPSCAVLRRHPSPPVSNYDPLIKVAEEKVSTRADIKFCGNWTVENSGKTRTRVRVDVGRIGGPCLLQINIYDEQKLIIHVYS